MIKEVLNYSLRAHVGFFDEAFARIKTFKEKNSTRNDQTLKKLALVNT